MEMTMIIIIGAIILVLGYYGAFSSIEVAADMGHRELKDLERMQKLRMVNKHATGSDVTDATIAKADKRIQMIDNLNI
jgi:hypothetical protein